MTLPPFRPFPFTVCRCDRCGSRGIVFARRGELLCAECTDAQDAQDAQELAQAGRKEN